MKISKGGIHGTIAGSRVLGQLVGFVQLMVSLMGDSHMYYNPGNVRSLPSSVTVH